MSFLNHVIISFLVVLLIFARAVSYAEHLDDADNLGGHVESVVDGKRVIFPTLKTDIHADIQGDLVTVTLQQIFANPLSQPINATYLFPINKDATVYAMTMAVGDEIIEAKIQKKEKAKKTFEKAKKKGKATTLLVQHRPNMFTQHVANLMPGLPIKVTLKYTQPVIKVDGTYQLVVPLVVGPRYIPAQLSKENQLPLYPNAVSGLSVPDSVTKDRVALSVSLNSGLPITSVTSSTHAIQTDGTSDYKKRIHLRKDRVIGNHDFVLHYILSGKSTQAGFLHHKGKKDNFFSLMIEPPEVPEPEEVTPREMVFVLDVSGSMGGEPINASKTFMREALKSLKSTDYFRIVIFSNDAGELSEIPLRATPENIKNGLNYVDALYAGGGTEVLTGLGKALDVKPADGIMRIVVFLTDGYIGNESEILDITSRKINGARLYAFGVSSAPNRFFLTEMAQMGQGFARFIDPYEKSNEVAKELAKRLKTPVLTDIEIDWGSLNVKDTTLKKIPDLFAGDSIRIQGKFSNPGHHTITIHGLVNNKPVNIPIKIDTTESILQNGTEAIPLIWARTKIEDYMRMYRAPYQYKKNVFSQANLQKKITRLGLKYSLMTKWTSFVAVSKNVVNKNPKSSQNTELPLPMVKGTMPLAYGNLESFSGNSTPEPKEYAMILVILILLSSIALYHLKKKDLFIAKF